MRSVIQRVTRASVTVDGACVAEMGEGLLALVGVGPDDDRSHALDMAHKLVHLRVFPDHQGRMNHSLLDVGGALGIVSQFTLFGDLRKGRRPSYAGAATPELAEPLVKAVVEEARGLGIEVVTGRFGAMMQVELVNDGPVTLLLDTEKRF
jgi:D-tyrosyl-tRNA(Tyr) deacylase